MSDQKTIVRNNLLLNWENDIWIFIQDPYIFNKTRVIKWDLESQSFQPIFFDQNRWVLYRFIPFSQNLNSIKGNTGFEN